MNNLLIIGNGFDLAHGLKTSYNHFIEYLVESHIKSNMYNDLFDFDGDFESLQNYREKNLVGKDDGTSLYHNYFKLIFLEILIRTSSLNNWCDIEKAYFDQLNPINKVDVSINPAYLNREFEIIKNYLAEYLKVQEKEALSIESYKSFFRLVDSKETMMLNFNYTNTLKYLYANEINESKIIHIHGELSSAINPIVFGYAASNEESRELIGKDENEYMRNIKKHLYKRTENEKLLTNYLKGTKSIDVTILGHSCGLSDKLILNQILNDDNIKSINVFYYEEYEQYFQTQVNIDRIMNNDEHFKKLVNFNSSHRMPQHKDTEEQQKAFLSYFKAICEERNLNRFKYNLGKSINVR